MIATQFQELLVIRKDQEEAFAKLKESLTSTAVVALYDPNLETFVVADAALYGFGTAMRQKQPMTISDRLLNFKNSRSTEIKYVQIEECTLSM